MADYHDFVINSLMVFLKDENFRKNYHKPGFKKIINELVRQYGEINSDGIKTWQKIELYKKHHKFSIRASELLSISDYWKDFHYEHIYSVSQTIKDLIKIDVITRESIINILDKCEVVILTKEESKLLDSNGYKSKGTANERLSFIGAVYCNNFIKNKL